MSEAFISKLSDDLNPVSPAMVGGKAFVLAMLYQRGFPVPKGFVITTHAFDHYLRLLGQDDKDNMSPDIAGAIGRSLDILDTSFVAVRSSATMEDGEQYSYAGQFESFLNVSRENVLRQVKMCWGSFFSPRAMAYSKNGIYGGKMAVLVQEMVEADVSGVCFSVNPVDSNTNTAIIELISGSGDALVQGAVTPDRYIVSKEPLAIQERHIVSDGAIPDGIIEEITRAVIEIENFYQKPMDMEFAVKDGHLHILQARPITAFHHA